MASSVAQRASRLGPLRLTRPTAAVLAALLADPTRELYGLQLMASTGLDSGTLYPMLRRLESRGWLTSRLEDLDPREEGRPRRCYFRLTPDGAEQARARLSSAATSRRAGPDA
ncbi:PadR family transcriptional regulator [Sphaerisporangium sp. NPDC051011]|uniref:PadR family transcriptional regulator n=1 Tax=Sphaerisporangium sp. NPDC051011 TaxID=3155792 RepID=UPI0033F82BA5